MSKLFPHHTDCQRLWDPQSLQEAVPSSASAQDEGRHHAISKGIIDDWFLGFGVWFTRLNLARNLSLNSVWPEFTSLDCKLSHLSVETSCNHEYGGRTWSRIISAGNLGSSETRGLFTVVVGSRIYPLPGLCTAIADLCHSFSIYNQIQRLQNLYNIIKHIGRVYWMINIPQ